MKPTIYKVILFIAYLKLLVVSNIHAQQKKQEEKFIYPAQKWLDSKGKAINAHGGGILFHNGIYYWYGEHKIEGKSEEQFADAGIHCYASADLINWTDAGIVLSVDYTPNSTLDLAYGCLIERPKVVYNSKTRMFIAYFKYYPKGFGYEIAYVGVAVAASPTGPFVYSHKFLGGGSPKGSGDFSMFQDDDGQLYHLAVRKPDKAFVMTRMNDDYLMPATEYTVCSGVEPHTEAPAIIKANGLYHLLGSGSTGWKPNVARYYTSTSIIGMWKVNPNPLNGFNNVDSLGVEKTFGGQSSFIIKVNGLKDVYIAMFDIWKPSMPIEGRYIWLPIQFHKKMFSIQWLNQWNLDIFK